MNISDKNRKFFAEHCNDFFLFPVIRFLKNSERIGQDLGASLEGITRPVCPSLLNYFLSVLTEDGVPIQL